MRSLVPACLLFLAFAVAACDSGPNEAPKIEETTFAPSLNVDLSQSTKTQSGLYFRDLVVGTGATPVAGEGVSILYKGSFTNGQAFDQTEANEPYFLEYKDDPLIAGFEEGLSTMKVGGRRQLIIPPDLGYGSEQYFDIPPNSILVFEVELISVGGRIESTTFAPSLNVDLSKSTKTQSGLYYRDLVVGTGETVAVGDSAFVHYTGSLVNGQQFDASRPRGNTLDFIVGVGRGLASGSFALIRGFDEGVEGMRAGGRRQLIIPPELGYGARPSGQIPANSILVFDVEVMKVK